MQCVLIPCIILCSGLQGSRTAVSLVLGEIARRGNSDGFNLNAVLEMDIIVKAFGAGRLKCEWGKRLVLIALVTNCRSYMQMAYIR